MFVSKKTQSPVKVCFGHHINQNEKSKISLWSPSTWITKLTGFINDNNNVQEEQNFVDLESHEIDFDIIADSFSKSNGKITFGYINEVGYATYVEFPEDVQSSKLDYRIIGDTLHITKHADMCDFIIKDKYNHPYNIHSNSCEHKN